MNATVSFTFNFATDNNTDWAVGTVNLAHNSNGTYAVIRATVEPVDAVESDEFTGVLLPCATGRTSKGALLNLRDFALCNDLVVQTIADFVYEYHPDVVAARMLGTNADARRAADRAIDRTMHRLDKVLAHLASGKTHDITRARLIA